MQKLGKAIASFFGWRRDISAVADAQKSPEQNLPFVPRKDKPTLLDPNKLKSGPERFLICREYEAWSGGAHLTQEDYEVANKAPYCFGLSFSQCEEMYHCPVGIACMRCESYLLRETQTGRPLLIGLFATDPPIRLLRSRYMADRIAEAAKDPQYEGKQPILVEQNILKSPPVKARLDDLVRKLEKQNPQKPVVVLEIQEPQWLLEKALTGPKADGGTMDLYAGGEAIDEEGRKIREKLHALATRIQALDTIRNSLSEQEYLRISGELQRELALLRRDHGTTVVYNQPEEWLRTAANDADLLLQYLAGKDRTYFYGLFIYSDLDSTFVQYINANWDAISALTGAVIQIFAFEMGAHFLGDQLILRHQAAASIRKQMLKSHSGILSSAEKETLENQQEELLKSVFSRNESLLVAEKLGIPRSETPCLIIWQDMESREFIRYSFRDSWIATGEFTGYLKELTDVLQAEAHEKQPLAKVETALSKLKIKQFVKRHLTAETLGTILKIISLGLGGSD